jgi:UDPglucose--hexose-1-phosphate uridylyltransferase
MALRYYKKEKRKMIYDNIATLVKYGIVSGLVDEDDKIYTTNRLLELFGLEEYEEPANIPEITSPSEFDLEGLLKEMLDYAAEKGILADDSIVYRDLFDTKIMGTIVPRPSDVIYTFKKLYNEKGAKAATDWYYTFSQNTDYIRRYRIAKDMKWKADTEYGQMDITINLSKPEKDPKAIAAAKTAKQSGYPKCQLCMENEGYSGRVNHPARQNHRIIPITIQGNKWGFQYSPYVYYNEHCIVFNSQHIPMKIEHNTFVKLFNFVEQFPHYFVGSNADLPIVGGSILSHDHFQGGHYEFAMAIAPVEKEFSVKGFEDIKAGIVKWPMSVIRLSHRDYNRIIELADVILSKWRGYTDEAAFIFAETNGEPHNTITPIARKRGDYYELDLVLRNNITTEEHPLGVYHPHAELHHIKKENIGLIEVMGLAVLPSRLKSELELLADAIVNEKDIRSDETLEKHADWVEEFIPKYDNINKDNVMDIIKKEVGIVFGKVLEHAGVYKRTDEGRAAFQRFIDVL